MKNALIFIDTNILLDFYRIRSSDNIGLPLLGHIDSNHPRFITGNQVEMEYKKNRQRVIIESLSRLKSPDWGSLTPPAFLAETQHAKAIKEAKGKINEKQGALKKKIGKVLLSPSYNDLIYQTLQRLFKNGSSYNLKRDMPVGDKIRRLACKRFYLGYPPRKDNDTSIGDAINWEWIIHCAKESGERIIIVSRDSDYGVKHSDELILNDWLVQEFRERVSKKRKIILTDRLSHAFKMAAISVTRNEEVQEEDFVKRKRDEDLDRIMQVYKMMAKEAQSKVAGFVSGEGQEGGAP